MKDAPSFVGIASLIGDPARATMLATLMGGEALTASELALEANVTKQTASSHLRKLIEGGLLSVQAQGRHRYFRLAAPDVAVLLESMMGLAQRTRSHVRLGPREPALRRARVCYDHLAGELAVAAYESFVESGLFSSTAGEPRPAPALTEQGLEFFEGAGIDADSLRNSRRPICRTCLDWSMRRPHLSGRLGKALLTHCYERRWAKKEADSRVVRFTKTGERAFRKTFIERADA